MKLRDLRPHVRPILGLLLVLAVLLMAAYPLALTGIDEALNPGAAAGSPLICDGHAVGSSLSGQNVSSPKLFQVRNVSASASGIDPDITPAAAYSQVPSVANATGIPASSLNYLIQQNINTNNAANWGFLAPEYVDVNALNLELIELYPSIYAGFCPT
jgi:potassium-transporting ATPase KdpC subunit